MNSGRRRCCKYTANERTKNGWYISYPYAHTMLGLHIFLASQKLTGWVIFPAGEKGAIDIAESELL